MKDLMGTSFVAKIRGVTPGYQRRIALSDTVIAGQSGWLTFADSEWPAAEFKFTYLSQTKDRFHYAITGADSAGYYANATLGVSSRGYLGLYHLASIENVWKFDLVSVSYRDGRFFLRDKDGYRVTAIEVGVGNLPVSIPYLNTSGGTLLEFTLEDVRS